MASSLTISRVTWVSLGVVSVALIINVICLVLVVMDRSNMMKERKENDKRIADLERQMMSPTKQRDNFDKLWNDRISSIEMKMSRFENLTDPPGDHTHASRDHTHASRDHTHPTQDHTHSPQDHNHATQLVAFSVGSSKQFTATSTTRIPMNVMIYNDGGYFRAADENSFHVPVKGVYEFSFSALSQVSRWTKLLLYTRKTDGRDVGVAASSGYVPGGFVSSGGSAIVKLDVGETVSVWLDRTDRITGNNPPYTLFSGKLLYKLD